jgi:hypothetical protein
MIADTHTGLRVKSSSNDVSEEDKEFLARLEEEAPEALEGDINSANFKTLLKRLADSAPAPKRK